MTNTKKIKNLDIYIYFPTSCQEDKLPLYNLLHKSKPILNCIILNRYFFFVYGSVFGSFGDFVNRGKKF